MTGQREFLDQLVRQLEGTGVPFMIAGSIASSFHGEPRATRDIDLVIDCSRDQLAALLEAVQQLGWYVNPDAAMAAHAERTMFNIIDPASGWKADLIVRKMRDFSSCEFERRITVQVFGPDSIPVMVTTPEDTILSKLEWARDAHSEQQYRDALSVAVLGGQRLDRDYLRRWAAELRVSEALERLLAEADEHGPSNV
ncbi:MAG: nucleotidyl transferase AbiEii/AbiGii toxin family protein [Planctomycetes bacterium]|nr:nucleotidyl transferase AbiEii/AbiGii toxin family protein [Planctomycetota bacterium]